MAIDIQLAVGWKAADISLDLRALAQILAGIVSVGTVRGAADHLGLSYRTVWGRLESAQSALGQALIIKSRGRGSELTPAGRDLLNLFAQLDEHLNRAIHEEAVNFQQRFDHLFSNRVDALRLACNYDLVVDHCLHEEQLGGWTVSYMGANKVVAALLGGRTDVAGFHYPTTQAWPDELAALRDNDAYVLTAVMAREAGLVVAKGNPLEIRALEDLTRASVRFINRQRNAGMRHWFDALLHECGIRPQQINGYRREEFTHQAVATAVAAGTADACFTLRAVAADLAVDFIPIGLETYYLAGHAELAGDARFVQLRETLAAESIRHLGYLPTE